MICQIAIRVFTFLTTVLPKRIEYAVYLLFKRSQFRIRKPPERLRSITITYWMTADIRIAWTAQPELL